MIAIGEIRDTETAQMAIEASLTGHLVLSTLHTNSAPETVTRLLDMGMDPFNFAGLSARRAGQRLVRRLCTHCRIERPATEQEIGELLDDYLQAFPRDAQPVTRDTLRADWTERFGRDGRPAPYDSPAATTARAPASAVARHPRTDARVARPASSSRPASAPRCCNARRWPRACARCARTASRRCWGWTSIEEVRATSNVWTASSHQRARPALPRTLRCARARGIISFAAGQAARARALHQGSCWRL